MAESKLLTRRQAAKKSDISPPHFNYLIKQHPFSSYLIKDQEFEWLVDEDVLPKMKDYYNSQMEAYHYYEAHSDYLIAYRVAPVLNMTNQELLNEIKEGKWDELIVKVPRVAPPKTTYGQEEKYHYFFSKSKLFKNKYSTVEQIALNSPLISSSRLQEYKSAGLLPQPDYLKGTNLFDEKEIIGLIPTLKLKFKESSDKENEHRVINAFDLLNSTQQEIITKYLNYRKKGGIIDYNGYRSKASIANKTETLNVMKSKLAAVFIIIISGRCGIENDFHKNPLKHSTIPKSFDPDVFNVYSITKEDYFYLSKQRKPSSLIQSFHQLRPFYYYLLDSLNDEVIESDDLRDLKKFKIIENRVMKFLKQFPRQMWELNASDYDKKVKSFLTREQMVLVKSYILEDPRSSDPIRYATMWQLSCSAGVRPQEQHKLKISDFKLNSEGLIDQDEDGWGLLMLPADVSKQNISPSHPEFHTPLPKSTVEQLNIYLSRVYKLQGENNPKGEGYLFRPYYEMPFVRYKKPIDFYFINRLRHRLDFLNDAQKEDFIFKSSRHSLNNTIMRTYILKETGLNEAKRTASDHQLRHKSSKTVGEEYYLDDISREQYYKVLDLTINFPWDLEGLKIWEINHGYRNPTDQPKEKSNSNTKVESSIQLELLKIEGSLELLKEKPTNMSEIQWIEERKQLLEEKEYIQSKIRGMN
jgi:integrase